MATSSITHSFVLSTEEQVMRFVNAIEESAKNRPERTPVAAKFAESEADLLEFLEEREKARANAN